MTAEIIEFQDERKKIRMAEAFVLERIFMDVVKEYVSDEEYIEFLDEAKRRHELG